MEWSALPTAGWSCTGIWRGGLLAAVVDMAMVGRGRWDAGGTAGDREGRPSAVCVVCRVIAPGCVGHGGYWVACAVRHGCVACRQVSPGPHRRRSRHAGPTPPPPLLWAAPLAGGWRRRWGWTRRAAAAACRAGWRGGRSVLSGRYAGCILHCHRLAADTDKPPGADRLRDHGLGMDGCIH